MTRFGSKPIRAALITIGVLAALFAVLAIGIANYDWNRARGYVERQVTDRTGRSFEILGNLSVRPSLTPRVRFERVTLGNAAWGSREAMIQADAIELRISLWPLLFGRLVLPEITATRPDVLLERGPNGETNWQLAPVEKKGRPPKIGRLTVTEGVFRYRNPHAKTDLRFRLDTIAQKRGEPMMTVRADGTFSGEQSAIEGEAGSLLSLERSAPYPVDLKGHIGRTYFDLRGAVVEPIRFQGANLDIKLKGPDLSKLRDIIDIPMPETPPYDLQGQLEHKGKQWRIGQFNGRVGESDLTGHLTVDLAGRYPFLRANLRSRYLDINDLGGLIGATPGTRPGETASPEQRREAERMRRRGRLLPDRPYSPLRMRSVNFDVEFRGERIKSKLLPLDNLDMHAVLKDGMLNLMPLNFGIAGGNVVATALVDARHDPLNVKANATVRALQLNRMFPNAKLPDLGQGRFGGQAKVSTSGNSLATMAAKLDGDVGIAIAGGTISKLLLELAEIDVGEAATFFLGKDKQVPIRCGVADFRVVQGDMRVENLVFDTADSNFKGEGNIRLGPETLDLTIHARPKNRSILSARAPLKIQGHFTAPNVAVKGSRIAERGAAAFALGAAAGPLAALIPLIETGPGKNADCHALIAGMGEETAKGQGAGGGKR